MSSAWPLAMAVTVGRRETTSRRHRPCRSPVRECRHSVRSGGVGRDQPCHRRQRHRPDRQRRRRTDAGLLHHHIGHCLWAAPVTYPASADARIPATPAASAAVRWLFIGIASAIPACNAAASGLGRLSTAVMVQLSMGPGLVPFTRLPRPFVSGMAMAAPLVASRVVVATPMRPAAQ